MPDIGEVLGQNAIGGTEKKPISHDAAALGK